MLRSSSTCTRCSPGFFNRDGLASGARMSMFSQSPPEGFMRIHLPTALLVSLASLAACSKGAATRNDTAVATTSSTSVAANTASAPRGNDDKIKNAMSAAPDSISAAATIMDWPATAGGKPTQLRAGTNGWVCYPSTPSATTAVGEDPMCLDREFQKWAEGYLSKKPPKLSAIGVGYMLQGDRGASISDPFAESSAKAKDWVVAGPHVMIASPSAGSLSSLPGKPGGGVPWVMWKGTPYAHIMVPVKT